MSISRQYQSVPVSRTVANSPDLVSTVSQLIDRVTQLELKLAEIDAVLATLVVTRNQADGNVTTSVTRPKRDRAQYMRERRRAKKT